MQPDHSPSPVRPGDLWPLPPSGAGERVLMVVANVLLVPLAVVAGEGVSLSFATRGASVAQQARSIAEGREESVPGAVFGPGSWVPRFPDLGDFRLSSGSVVYSQGVDRPVPVGDLLPQGVRRARDVATPRRLPRAWWVLEVAGPGGTGQLAGPLDALALIGAAARWPVPAGWPTP